MTAYTPGTGLGRGSRPLTRDEEAVAGELARQVLDQRPTPTFEYVALASVHSDGYQRDLRQAWVAKIVREFSVNQMQPIDVSLRADGTFFVIDGQHRCVAARKLGRSVIGAMVHRDLTPADEAILFWLFQRERHALSAWDSYAARLFGHEPIAVGVDAAVRAAGLTLGRGKGFDIQAIVMLEQVYRAGNGALLSEVLDVIKTTWPMASRRFESHIVGGLAIILLRYQQAKVFDRQRLIDVLSVMPPSAIIAATREAGGSPSARDRMDYTAAKVIRDQYNRRLAPARRFPALTSPLGRALPTR